MTTIEGNKLIAEFMGLKCDPYYYIPQHCRYTLKYGMYDFEEHFNEDELKYHSSWDWLMPVVEKIENLELNTIKEVNDSMLGSVKAYFDINRAHTLIYLATNWCISNVRYGDSKLLSTYFAIVEFIEWYNANK